MELPSYFIDFLANIRPTDTQTRKMAQEHKQLQELLRQDSKLKPVLITTFIQGSYRRHTALKAFDDDPCDVDIVAVTRFDKRTVTPQAALDAFRPFLEEHYPGKYEPQGRSWGITVDKMVKLDLVPTAAPSEAMQQLFENKDIESWFEPQHGLLIEQKAKPPIDPIMEAIRALITKDPKWTMEPLDIPDREAKIWDQTHPLAQIQWTSDKNTKTTGHYVNIIKAVKWWRRTRTTTPKHPKGYPLEHLLGENCPNEIKGVGSGLTLALENAVKRYYPDVQAGRTPYLHDHGFPIHERTHNVMRRVSPNDFAAFYQRLQAAVVTARRALDEKSMYQSTRLWRELFGDEFPEAPPDKGDDKGSDGDKGGFTPRKDVSVLGTTRFG